MPIYMRYTRSNGLDIKGGATAEGHTGWIELSEAKTGDTRLPRSGPGGSKSPQTYDIVIKKAPDASSAALFGETTQGAGAKVQIDFVTTETGKPVVWRTVELEQTLVLSIKSTSVDEAGNRVETVTLNTAKISLPHVPGPRVPSPPAPPTSWSWDVEQSAG
jgi:type VI protein secretion system component Hcp